MFILADNSRDQSQPDYSQHRTVAKIRRDRSGCRSATEQLINPPRKLSQGLIFHISFGCSYVVVFIKRHGHNDFVFVFDRDYQLFQANNVYAEILQGTIWIDFSAWNSIVHRDHGLQFTQSVGHKLVPNQAVA